jgi:cysteine sulfinate desulfinase/cysteine desulfurase-like protein
MAPNGGVNPLLHDPAYRVTYLPVDREGLLNLADLEAAITDETAVVSLMWANNETGMLFPLISWDHFQTSERIWTAHSSCSPIA